MKNNNSKIVVVKLGSSIATTKRQKLDTFRLARLAKQTTLLQKRGVVVVFVISGAVVCGEKILSFGKGKTNIVCKQFAAGVGQAYLISQLLKTFADCGFTVAQVLLTKADLKSKTKRSNLKKVINLSIKQNVIVVINENDAIELNSFAGNDFLASQIAQLLDAEYLINLTDVNGVYFKNTQAIRKISPVDKFNFARMKNSKRKTGVGGMKAKIIASQKAAQSGIKVIIANGKTKNILTRLVVNQEQLGTEIITHKKV